MATPPTADEIRVLSRVPFDSVGWGRPEDSAMPDLLQEELDSVIPWIEDLTGYYYEPLAGQTPQQFPLEERREARFRRAIRMAVEFEAFKSMPEAIEDLIDFAEVQAMSAGSYNEQRRTYSQAMRAHNLHPWPALAALLVQLMHSSRKSRAEGPVVGLPDPRYRPGSDLMRDGRRVFNPFGYRSNPTIVSPAPWYPSDC